MTDKEYIEQVKYLLDQVSIKGNMPSERGDRDGNMLRSNDDYFKSRAVSIIKTLKKLKQLYETTEKGVFERVNEQLYKKQNSIYPLNWDTFWDSQSVRKEESFTYLSNIPYMMI